MGDLKEKTRARAERLAKNMAPHRGGQVILKLPLESQFTNKDQQDLFQDFKFVAGREIHRNPDLAQKMGGRLFVADLPRELTVAQAVAALEEDGRVLHAEPNHLVSQDGRVLDTDRSHSDDQYTPPEGAPVDLRASQWNFHNEGQTGGVKGADVSALKAWELSKGAGVTIAFLDTGIDLQNPDFAPNLWVNPGEIPGDGIDNDGNGYIDDVHGINLVNRQQPPDDDNGHGSYNASIVAAVEGNDPATLVGLAPQSKMMSIKFLENTGRGDIAAAIEGLAYAESHGARVVLNGWMSYTQNQSLFEVIEASQALHVCSAGNDGYDNDIRPAHPASFPLSNVVAVAATDHHDDFTRFTNRGAHSVDLAAPGRKIPVYDQNGRISLQGGAALATAHVAATAALGVARFPGISNEALATRIIYNGDPLPQNADRVLSGLRLNSASALRDDTVPPEMPGAFTVETNDGSNLKLSFITVSDNGALSKEPVAFYEARISSRPIVDDDEAGEGTVAFSNATPVPLELAQNLIPGQEISTSFAVGPSANIRNFHLAIRATDKVGNRSDINRAEIAVPKSNVVFEDGFELGQGETDRWTLEGQWARVNYPGRGVIVTDSPEGDYDNNVDASLVSPPLDLSGLTNAKLNFDARYTIEPKHDACLVEVETNGWFGKKWKEIGRLDGFSEWKNQEIDLSDYVGRKDVKIRFRMKTDRDRVAYGIQLDHVTVSTRDPQSTS